MKRTEPSDKKRKLIEATVKLMLRQGYAATTVDQICAEAGVTKGTFFHYFPSKEEIALAAMEMWGGFWQQILQDAQLEAISDPLDRLYRLFDVMKAAYLHPGVDPGCMVGTVAQETALPNETMRKHSAQQLQLWAGGVTKLLTDAKESHPPKTDFDPESVALFMMGMVQGTMLLAKTLDREEVVLNNVAHCRAYVESLFAGN